MRVSLRLLQHLCTIILLMAFVMIGVTALIGEYWLLGGFGALALAAGSLALLFYWSSSAEADFSSGEIMASVALAWALAAVLGAIPFIGAAIQNPGLPSVATFDDSLNALFEAASGFTSTGLTMVDRPGDLPHALQFWRTLMEWTGGIGLALLAIALMNPRTDHDDLYSSELNKPFGEDPRRMVLEIWAIYTALTVLGIGLFCALGMAPWESLNHGMTAIATGGFAVTNDSFGAYSTSLQGVAVFLTLLGAISFAAYHEVLHRRNPLILLRRGPVVFVLLGVVAATGLLSLSQSQFESDGGFMTYLFQTASAFGTAGFSTVSLGDWHSAPLTVLILCMLIGGASGATTGGVKADRILLLCRGIGWRLQRLFGRDSEQRVLDGDRVSAEDARIRVETAATLVSLWMLTALAGCLVLAPVAGEEWDFTQIGFEVMSALGSVGLSVGITGADLPASGKWLLIVLMWLGRLELFAVFALFWMPIAKLRAARAALGQVLSRS